MVYIRRADATQTSFILEVNKERPPQSTLTFNSRLPARTMEMLNLKPLSKYQEWSPEAPSGVGATGVAYVQDPNMSLASTSSEERAIRRVVGRWGAEWLS